MVTLRTEGSQKDEDDRVHVQRTLRSGADNFAPLVEKYQRRIANLIFRMVKKRDLVAELTQDVFLLAYKNLSRFNEKYRFFPWLSRIAHNHTLNKINKRRVKALSLDDPIGQDGGSVQDLIQDWSTNPEGCALERDKMHWVAKGLEILPERYRFLMLYRYWLGMSYKEIAFVTGLKLAKIKYLLNYGRRILHDILNGLRPSKDH